MAFSREKLVSLVVDLLERLEEGEKNDFISRNIDTKLALENAGAGDGRNFLDKIRKFCGDCSNGDYYIEVEYDDYWDSYDENSLEEAEWAGIFAEYLSIAVMYSRNRDYQVAFEAFDVSKELFYDKISYDYYKRAR
jgi:hypothetical protein